MVRKPQKEDGPKTQQTLIQGDWGRMWSAKSSLGENHWPRWMESIQDRETREASDMQWGRWGSPEAKLL